MPVRAIYEQARMVLTGSGFIGSLTRFSTNFFVDVEEFYEISDEVVHE